MLALLSNARKRVLAIRVSPFQSNKKRHRIDSTFYSLAAQLQWVRKAGYPYHLISAIMRSLLKKVKCSEKTSRVRSGRQAVVPCCHWSAQTLKKVGARYAVPVASSSPNQLVGFNRSINTSNGEEIKWTPAVKRTSLILFSAGKQSFIRSSFPVGGCTWVRR